MSAVKQQANGYHPARSKNTTAGYTAEEHAAAKRASKARKRSNRRHKNRGVETNGFGTDVERMNYFSLELMDRLDGAMTSSSPSKHEQLRAVLTLYMGKFAANLTGADLAINLGKLARSRHSQAMDQALPMLTDKGLQGFARSQFNAAFHDLRRKHRI